MSIFKLFKIPKCMFLTTMPGQRLSIPEVVVGTHTRARARAHTHSDTRGRFLYPDHKVANNNNFNNSVNHTKTDVVF